MKCPYCGEIDNKVIDSRLSKEKNVIRRRRECIGCSRRFTTYEHVEEIPVMIIKKDGRREIFNREKVRRGILRACEKRHISMDTIETFLDELERDLKETEEKETPSYIIGEKIMLKLHELDDVAYVRFVSVYREFKDVNDFVSELKNLLSKQDDDCGIVRD
ncbi:Transcriptional repressor [Desulfonema limicola]|uniref:Transcriptional repressor NrdR n=1 Tax=Desulfonema limicola TaxID=45656 RepID=A0A975GFN6_9BACT|nr:transcriptional regulator NrdR [Desulfonema limicola]QTA79496.1 Transcriptional repressor [Desulfonema limicola]